MSVPEAVWNEIKALKQAHAELAAKVDALAHESLVTRSGISQEIHGSWQTASKRMDNFVDNVVTPKLRELSDRIAALESPAPAPDPVCASCGHGSEDHTFGQGECMEPICGCAGFVPTAEPAPLDPVLLDQSELSLLQALIRKALMGQRNDSTRFRLNAINAKLIAYGRDGAR